MKTADELLIELCETLTCIHLDMGGKDKYMAGHKSQPVLREIKEYVRRITGLELGKNDNQKSHPASG